MRELAEDKKAMDSLVLDMRRASNLCDYFFICSAASTRQAKAVADHITETLKEKGIKPAHAEGYKEGRWIILDYNAVIAHILDKEMRAFYRLERLWGDAPHIVPAKPGLKKKKRCKKIPSKKASPALSRKR
ncbi:MAG: ribosome silencing factor [Candidatus Omnitrophica bacterium]|nr:ribosome silencing factor [Candidatus Omnitrophota bacterium]